MATDSNRSSLDLARTPARQTITPSAIASSSTPNISTTARQDHASESSDEGIRMSPAAARRFARRSLRRMSPTPDLVTSLVRPPSPDAFYMAPQMHARVRMDGHSRSLDRLPAGNTGVRPSGMIRRRSGPICTPHLSSLDLPRRYGGSAVFDMYSLTCVSEPDANLLCPICHDPLVDPVTTPCDHTFCYRCLRRSIASSPSGSACPIDREPLEWSECFSAARLIRTQLNNLVVKCPHHGRGCNKEVRREVVETHISTECRFTSYKCPDTNCEKKLRLKPTDDTCLHVQSKCDACEATIEAADRDLHMLTCPKSKTRCEACWQLVCRTSMDAHHEVDCDGVEVACTYQDLGCPTRMSRGLMPTHTNACAFHPDTPSGAVIRSQREVIQSYSDIQATLQELQARQEDTNRRMDELSSSAGRRGPTGDALLGDNRTMQDLDAGFEEIHQNLTHLEARQSMWTMNQVMPIREEVTELRNNINMIRMHVNWLLNRSREEGRIRAANTSGTGAGLRRDTAGDPIPSLPERRRSSGAEADLPRL